MSYSNSLHAATFHSIWADRDVPLNTSPQSDFWCGADPIFFENDNFGDPIHWMQTEVHSRWTMDNLYLLFECPYRELYLKPSPDTKTETYGLWDWDVAEIFIGFDFENIRNYKEFEISPQGEWVDLDINLNNPHPESGWTWRSGIEVIASIEYENKIWYGAMRIPFRAIDPNPPQTGILLRVNLFRCQGPPPDRKLLAWQPPMSTTFHVPERFGFLKLL